MERSRLKTIIILILAMINLALALSLGLRLAQGRAAEAALLMELRQRFTAEGCALPETGQKRTGRPRLSRIGCSVRPGCGGSSGTFGER